MATVKKTLHQKLIDFHLGVGTIRKDSVNPHFRSKFADINSVLKVVMPVLTASGIVAIQETKITENGGSYLVTVLVNADDKEDFVSSEIPLMTKDKSNPQQFGSALTYARRYALVSMLQLEAEDDDANYASSPQGGNYPQQQQQSNYNYKGR